MPEEWSPQTAPRWIALRLALSVGAGWLLFLSFPPRTLWFLAPVAIALLTVVLQGRSLRAGFGFGYAAGLGFFVPLLPWVGAYVGATPWLALAAIEALAFGVFGGKGQNMFAVVPSVATSDDPALKAFVAKVRGYAYG